MASINVLPVKHKKKDDDTYPLAVRVTINRKSSYKYLGHYIKLKDWDEAKARVRKSHPNSVRLNNLIKKKLTEREDVVLESDSNRLGFSASQIKKEVDGEGRNTTFFQLGEQYISDLRKAGKFNQANADEPRINIFKKFSGSELRFTEITEGLLRKFKTHLKSQENPVNETTAMNYLVVIRTLFNRAITDRIVEAKYYPFGKGGMQIKFPESIKIGLEEKEIKQLEETKLNVGRGQWHARNVFLFSFYLAGARVADVLKLKWSDVEGERITYRMGKNNKPVSFKLPAKALAIINLYEDVRQGEEDYIFPELKVADPNNPRDVHRKVRNANSALNKSLKRLATDLEIKKNISMHISRHTFGNISGDKIPIQQLQKLYRHSNVSTTIGYQASFMSKDLDDALETVIDF